jgi:hypothetical protein
VARLSGLKNKNGGLSFGGKILLRVLWYFEVTKKPKMLVLIDKWLFEKERNTTRYEKITADLVSEHC